MAEFKGAPARLFDDVELAPGPDEPALRRAVLPLAGRAWERAGRAGSESWVHLKEARAARWG
eukprot:2274763-Lingulodinium_polyedra.AAC.1